MAERNRKDYSQRAYDIVAKATGMSSSSDLARAKAGAAARKSKLSPERRSEIARIAAAARWAKNAQSPNLKIVKPTQKQARESS